MGPVGLGQAHADPAGPADIGRPGEQVRLGLHQQLLLVAAGGLEADDRAAVAMMVVAEVGEHLAGHPEGRDAVRDRLVGLGQGQGQGLQPGQQAVGVGAEHLSLPGRG